MKKSNYITGFLYVIMIFITPFLWNCTPENSTISDDDILQSVKLEIRSDITSASRSAVKEHWVKDDVLTLFLAKHDANGVTAKGMYVPSFYEGAGKWFNGYVFKDDRLSVYAYYPEIEESGIYLSSNDAPYLVYWLDTNVDVLTGTHAENTPTFVDKNNPVCYLHMKHALATVEFFIKKEDYTGTGNVSKIEMANRDGLNQKVIPFEIYINLITGSIVGDGGGTISVSNANGLMPNLTNNYQTSAINFFALTNTALAQTGDVIIKFTIDGKEYTWNVPRNTEWKSGYRYSYYVTISGAQVSLDTVSIKEPEEAGSAEVNL